MTTALTTVSNSGELATAEDEFPVARLVAQKTAIQRALRAVMQQDQHYGVIPGTERKDKDGKDISKPSLFQPGADTLCFLFRLTPAFEVTDSVMRDDLISYDVRCVLSHIDTGLKWGEGMGSCNSREKRYASQASAKVCPACKKPAIIKGKKDYGGGWLCFQKKDGCGAKFKDGDETIEGQEGQATSAGVWDLKNTILKMACKRAKVAAVLTATAASDCFTQDLEDLVEVGTHYTPPAATPSKWTSGTENAPKHVGVMGLAKELPDAVHEDNELTADVDAVVEHVDETTGEVTLETVRLPGASSGQVGKIHELLDKLGHHMDERVPAKTVGKTGKVLEPAKLVKRGLYYRHMMAKYGAKHSTELSGGAASEMIDWLFRCVAKLERKRGEEPPPETPKPAFAADCPDGVCGLCAACYSAQQEELR